MFSDFHFLNPEWFFALLPLSAILWGIGRGGAGAGAWQQVVDPNLLPHLLVQGGGRARRRSQVLLAIGWFIAVIALANPTFERLPVPAFRGELARVVILDLSRSMETPDLQPSRLERARYKVADILGRSRDGQTGLIAFAGDAFVVSPLTDDADTILAMLDALVPEIMPVQGSRPDLAIAKAAELLARAVASQGEVILVGDDAGGPDALEHADALASRGHSLSVIGVGTEEGAPIPGQVGADGRPVLSRLDPNALRELASAGGGVFAPLSADGRDLDLALRATADMRDDRLSDETMETEVWRELGPWVLLAVLPLAALAFRRGWLLALAIWIGNGVLVPEPASALTWDDLWKRRDQQAAAALEQGENERALDLAEQPQQRGTASYRLGDFEAAAEAFAGVEQADGHYNLGNALARSGRLEEAIAAYDQALAKQPEMEDAVYNKALLEELLEQQQQEQQPPREDGDQGEQGEESDEQQSSEQSQEDQASGEQSQQDKQAEGTDQEDSAADQQDGAGQEQKSGDKQQEFEEGEDREAAQASDRSGESEDTPPDRTAGSASEPSSDDNADPADSEDPDDTERAAADYREEAARHEDGQSPEQAAPSSDEPSTEEREAQQAANQWLRRIPDDPAGLLRRKFLYQYRSRAAQQGAVTSGDPW
jgi:Ca-activated chloride channel family protein